MAKILITGGAGFLGSHVTALLQAAGYDLTVVDAELKAKKYFYVPGVEYIKAEVKDSALLERVRAGEWTGIVHLAAQTSVVKSVQDPSYDAEHNILQPLALLEAAVQGGVKRFVFSSTGGAIYGDSALVPTPHREDAQPLAPYGVSKLALERYLHGLSLRSSLKTASLRFANIYGPHQVLEEPLGDGGVVPIFLDRVLRTHEPLVIFGDGAQTRDFVYVVDAARAILLALDSELVGSWNVGTGTEISVNDLCAQVLALAGSSEEVKHAPARPGEITRSALECTQTKIDLGWTPQVSFADGLKATFDWYQDFIS
jgi:UDP-glucose 4-epimerase